MGFKFSHKKRGKKFHSVYFEVLALLSEKPKSVLLSGSFTNLTPYSLMISTYNFLPYDFD